MNKVLVTLTGPTCSGKSTLENRLVSLGFESITSFTTRARRESEVDWHRYHFVQAPRFEQMIANNSFIEYTKLGEHYYGSAISTFENAFKTGKPVVFVCDPEGRKQIEIKAKEYGWSLIKVFIDAKRDKQLERFLARFSDEFQKASDTDAKAALQKNYAIRLYQAIVSEQSWVSEAYRWNRPYDLLIDRYDEQTAAEVEVMISELAAISKIEKLEEVGKAA